MLLVPLVLLLLVTFLTLSVTLLSLTQLSKLISPEPLDIKVTAQDGPEWLDKGFRTDAGQSVFFGAKGTSGNANVSHYNRIHLGLSSGIWWF